MSDKKQPNVRFDGFTDDWEQRQLKTIYKRVNERNQGQFSKDKWISVAKMYFQDMNKVQSNNIDTRTYVMRKGDIAFEGHANNEFKFGRFVENVIGDGVISELFPVYRPRESYDLNYWKIAIQIEKIMEPIFAKSLTSSGNSSNKLNEKDFLKQYLNVPELNEQKKIGELFRLLEKNIASNQHKLDELKKVKKLIMQKIFDQEWRFKGFTDPWEQRKYSDIVQKFEYGLNAPATSYDGIHKYIRITDIDDELRTFKMDNITSPDISFDEYSEYLLKTGDVLFARTGASTGKTYLYDVKNGCVYFAGFLIRGHVKPKFDTNFFFQSTLTQSFKNFVAVTSQRSGQPGINSQEYGKYKISLPIKLEQEKIGKLLVASRILCK
jgi:type I restriction enzyme S subunit